MLELTVGMARMVEPYERLLANEQVSKQLARPNGKSIRKFRSFLSEAQNHRCAKCGIRFSDDKDSPAHGTIEHFIPQAFGGPWVPANLAMTCYPCNFKRNKVVKEVRAVYG